MGFAADDFVPDNNLEALPCDASFQLFKDVHAFMAKRVLHAKCTISLSGYVLSVYESFAQGIAEFIRENPDIRETDISAN